MIKTFRHKGLQRFWTKGETKKLPPKMVQKITLILDLLDAAEAPTDMNIPGLKFHGLTGPRKGDYAVWVTGNWRIVFRWKQTDAIDVNLEDYH